MMVKVSRGEEVEWFGVLEGFSLSVCHIAQGARNKEFLQTRVSMIHKHRRHRERCLTTNQVSGETQGL